MKKQKVTKVFYKILVSTLMLSWACLNSAQAATPPDVNADGCVDSADVQALQSGFSPNSVESLAAVMHSWGSGCQGAVVSCPKLAADVNTGKDASKDIKDCINLASSGGTVALPAGVYMVNSQVRNLAHRSDTFTITTLGKKPTDPPCNYGATHDCAEIRASANFNADGKSDYGVVAFLGTNITLDHIVVNGNKTARVNSNAWKRCNQANTSAGDTAAGYNITVDVSGFKFTNSVSKNGLCASGLGLTGKNILVQRSAIVYNGTHNVNMMWSDGITSGDNNDNLQVLNSTFIDNTDVQLIVGPSKNTIIQNNTISHSNDPAGGSFGALAIYDWPVVTTNNPTYAGSIISNNTINCGTSRNCGVGLLIGADPWAKVRPLHVSGATITNNIVVDGQAGISVDDATQNVIKNNTSTWTDPTRTTLKANCGVRQSGTYIVGNDSSGNDFGGQVYKNINLDNCIANWPF